MNVNYTTLVGLVVTCWFVFTHPGNDHLISAALAALWAYTHGQTSGNGNTPS